MDSAGLTGSVQERRCETEGSLAGPGSPVQPRLDPGAAGRSEAAVGLIEASLMAQEEN